MVGTAASGDDGCLEGFPFQLLPTHSTMWSPDQAKVTMNARMDARLVPSPASPGGVRLAYSHVVVLDSFFGEPEREALLAELTQPGWDHSKGPPGTKWERETADTHTASLTWGLRDHVLRELAEEPSQAMLEVNSRLAQMYPEFHIALMPAKHMQHTDWAGEGATLPPQQHDTAAHQLLPAADGAIVAAAAAAADSTQSRSSSGEDTHAGQSGAAAAAGIDATAEGQHAEQAQHEVCGKPDSQGAFCAAFVGNAPVHGDTYCYHWDADPSSLPPSRWTEAFGDYINGEPGQPLLVSMLLYLDDQWPRDWGAETLFLDDETDVGLVVRPKRGRVVLMDQDVLHRVSAPSSAAGGRPRYSLIWKLAFLAKSLGQRCCLARPEWGIPASIGSAARVDAVKQSLARKRAKQEQPEGVLPEYADALLRS